MSGPGTLTRHCYNLQIYITASPKRKESKDTYAVQAGIKFVLPGNLHRPGRWLEGLWDSCTTLEYDIVL